MECENPEDSTLEDEGKPRERRHSFLSAFSSAFKDKKSKTSREEFDQGILKLDLEKYAEKLVDIAEGWESDGWEFVCEEKGITITRTSVAHTSIKCTKGVAVFKATPKEVFDLVRNVDIYKKWDQKIIESKTIHTINNKITINYFEFAPFFPIAARDACFLQYVTRQTNGTYVVCWHSVDDPDVPRKKGIVRAHMNHSGFVIMPLQRQSLVTFVVQFDLKGWIPTNVMNSATASQPMLLAYVEDELKQIQEQVRQRKNEDQSQQNLHTNEEATQQ